MTKKLVLLCLLPTITLISGDAQPPQEAEDSSLEQDQQIPRPSSTELLHALTQMKVCKNSSSDSSPHSSSESVSDSRSSTSSDEEIVGYLEKPTAQPTFNIQQAARTITEVIGRRMVRSGMPTSPSIKENLQQLRNQRRPGTAGNSIREFNRQKQLPAWKP